MASGSSVLVDVLRPQSDEKNSDHGKRPIVNSSNGH